MLELLAGLPERRRLGLGGEELRGGLIDRVLGRRADVVLGLGTVRVSWKSLIVWS